MRRQHRSLVVRRASNCGFLSSNRISYDVEFAQKELISAQTPVGPRVEIDEDPFSGGISWASINDKGLVSDRSTKLLQNYAPRGYLSLQYFINPQSNVGIDSIVTFVDRATDGEDFSSNDSAGAYDHVVIVWKNYCGCEAGLGQSE
jgi:hypothetical protein